MPCRNTTVEQKPPVQQHAIKLHEQCAQIQGEKSFKWPKIIEKQPHRPRNLGQCHTAKTRVGAAAQCCVDKNGRQRQI